MGSRDCAYYEDRSPASGIRPAPYDTHRILLVYEGQKEYVHMYILIELL